MPKVTTIRDTIIQSMPDGEQKIFNAIVTDIMAVSPHVYFVGGCVRDAIMQKESHDIDVEVFGIQPEQLTDILAQHSDGKGVDTTYANFGIFTISNCAVDFTLPRKEIKTGVRHQDFDITIKPGMTHEESALRRDITINAIFVHASHSLDIIIDPFNGQLDCENGIIRAISKTFPEDPLRSIRAIRFATILNMSFDETTWDYIYLTDYSQISRAKFFEEVDKLFSHESQFKIRRFFDLLLKAGALKTITPEIFAMVGSEQDPEHHPEGDVYEHTMRVLTHAQLTNDTTTRPKIFLYAALYHDIAKPETSCITKHGRLGNPKHAEVGAKAVKIYLKSAPISQSDIDYVSAIIDDHMVMHNLTKPDTSDKTFRKIMARIDMRDAYALLVCDKRGRQSDSEKYQEDTLKLIDVYDRISDLSTHHQFGSLEPLIHGHDLIDIGFKPGKSFSDMLNYARNKQIEGQTKEQLIDYFTDDFKRREAKRIKNEGKE